jgi:hypothetical protein
MFYCFTCCQLISYSLHSFIVVVGSSSSPNDNNKGMEGVYGCFILFYPYQYTHTHARARAHTQRVYSQHMLSDYKSYTEPIRLGRLTLTTPPSIPTTRPSPSGTHPVVPLSPPRPCLRVKRALQISPPMWTYDARHCLRGWRTTACDWNWRCPDQLSSPTWCHLRLKPRAFVRPVPHHRCWNRSGIVDTKPRAASPPYLHEIKSCMPCPWIQPRASARPVSPYCH